jgi:hypothetical protein
MGTEKDYFDEGIFTFDKAIQNAVIVSDNRIGIFHTGRQNRVLIAFAKTITHAMSIQLIYGRAITMRPEIGLLDHFSIGTLTRALIDSAIMTLYLSEPSLSTAEWDLRRHVLFLHDLTNRKRFLTSMRKHAKQLAPPNDKEEYQHAKATLLAVIKRRGNELALPAEHIEELSKGQIVFMNGVRGAIREAGLDVKYFDFLHTYLSNHVHGHPVSYMRAQEQQISFETPSDFQLGFCGLCLEAGAQYLEAMTARVELFTGHEGCDPNGHLD